MGSRFTHIALKERKSSRLSLSWKSSQDGVERKAMESTATWNNRKGKRLCSASSILSQADKVNKPRQPPLPGIKEKQHSDLLCPICWHQASGQLASADSKLPQATISSPRVTLDGLGFLSCCFCVVVVVVGDVCVWGSN